jgi:hypothetical protein
VHSSPAKRTITVNDLRKQVASSKRGAVWRATVIPTSMKKDYPLKIWKENTIVTIYKNVIEAKDRYKVRYFDKKQPKSKTFTDPEVDEKYATQMVENLKRNQSNPLVFSTTDREEYITAIHT